MPHGIIYWTYCGVCHRTYCFDNHHLCHYQVFSETEGLSTALLAAVVRTVILYSRILSAALIGSIVWLPALQRLYDIGWFKSLVIAVVVGIAASIVGLFLPTLTGPL